MREWVRTQLWLWAHQRGPAAARRPARADARWHARPAGGTVRNDAGRRSSTPHHRAQPRRSGPSRDYSVGEGPGHRTTRP